MCGTNDELWILFDSWSRMFDAVIVQRILTFLSLPFKENSFKPFFNSKSTLAHGSPIDCGSETGLNVIIMIEFIIACFPRPDTDLSLRVGH